MSITIVLTACLFFVLGVLVGLILAIAIGHHLTNKRVNAARLSIVERDAELKRQFEPDSAFEYNPYPHPHLRAGWDRTPTSPQE